MLEPLKWLIFRNRGSTKPEFMHALLYSHLHACIGSGEHSSNTSVSSPASYMHTLTRPTRSPKKQILLELAESSGCACSGFPLNTITSHVQDAATCTFYFLIFWDKRFIFWWDGRRYNVLLGQKTSTENPASRDFLYGPSSVSFSLVPHRSARTLFSSLNSAYPPLHSPTTQPNLVH